LSPKKFDLRDNAKHEYGLRPEGCGNLIGNSNPLKNREKRTRERHVETWMNVWINYTFLLLLHGDDNDRHFRLQLLMPLLQLFGAVSADMNNKVQ